MTTYGDIAGKLAMRAALDLLQPRPRIFDPYEKENGPMNISIHLREIANGVIVSTAGTKNEHFFPSMEIAMSELPGIAAEALESARGSISLREALHTRAQQQRSTESNAWLDNEIGKESLPENEKADDSGPGGPVTGYTIDQGEFMRDGPAPVPEHQPPYDHIPGTDAD